MLTRVLVSKQLLYDVLINGVRISTCACNHNRLKTIIGTAPSVNSYDDICIVFSDDDKETDVLPVEYQRLRYDCENKIKGEENANE